MSGTGVLRDSDIDKVVQEYLRKRNLTDTLKVLELEIKAAGDTVHDGPSAALPGSASIEGLLLATKAEGNPGAYATEFDRFSTWVDGSLQPYRSELSSLLYPTFVHSYLNMIGLRATAEAHALFGEYKKRFLAVSGLAGKQREEDLHELQNITMPEHLSTNRLAKSMRSEKYPVRMSHFAYDLLVHHLQVNQLMLMLGVINENIAIEVSDLPQAGQGGAALAAPDLTDAIAVNQTPVSLQLLKNGIEQKFVELMAQRAELQAAAQAEDETNKLTKKQRVALQKEAAAAKTRRETVGEDRMVPQIPLPEISDERQSSLLAEMELREHAGTGGQPVSANAHPSAAFFTFVNTNQSLQCVTFTSDVQRVAAGFSDSSVRLYQMGNTGANNGEQQGQPLYFRGHTGPVYSLDFSADDSLLLSSSADGTIRLWSSELNIPLAPYRGHMLPVWDAKFAPYYGYYFASGGADRVARLWNTERSQPLRMFIGHQSDVDVVTWHPNCHYIATGSSDRTVRLWDVRTGGCVRILAGHGTGISAMSFSPDGSTLVSGDVDGMIVAWDVATAKQVASQSQHKGAVWSLAHSQGEGSVIASGGADCTVRLWSGIADKKVTVLQPLTTWKTKATPVASLAFTRRNLLLGAGGLAVQPKKSA